VLDVREQRRTEDRLELGSNAGAMFDAAVVR